MYNLLLLDTCSLMIIIMKAITMLVTIMPMIVACLVIEIATATVKAKSKTIEIATVTTTTLTIMITQ